MQYVHGYQEVTHAVIELVYENKARNKATMIFNLCYHHYV